MLERLLARLLATRLGRFVDGLDEENLSVALWKGEMHLEGLHLKAAAVEEALGLPVSLKWGQIGSFHLSIPWNALGAQPLSVTLADVTLVFGPAKAAGKSDDEAENLLRQRRARERGRSRTV